MATIKTLNINIAMGVASFGKGAKSVIGHIKGITDSVFTLKNALLGIGAAMIANKVTDWITGNIEELDNISEAANRLQTSVESLTALGHAAQMTDSSLETLTAGLEKFRNVLGKSDEDSDAAAKVFTELGLSAEALQAMDPIEAALKVGEALKGLPNNYQRAAHAAILFGKASGPELVALLTSSREEIKAKMQEAKDFGIALSDIDAAKIGESANSLDRIKAIWKGIGYTVAIEVSPFITAITKQIAEFAKGGKFVGFVKDAFRGFLAVLAKVLDALETIAGVIKGTVNFLNGAKDVIIDAVTLGLPGGAGLSTYALAKGMKGKQVAPQSSGEAMLSGFDAVFDKIQKDAEIEARKVAAEAKANREAERAEQARANAERLDAQRDAIRIGGIRAAEAGVAGIFKHFADEAVKLEEERKKAAAKIAESIKDSLKTPTQKLQEQLDSVRMALRDGLLDGGQAMAWRNKTLEDLKKQEEELTKREPLRAQLPTALRRGSVEEIAATNSFFAGTRGLDPIKQLDKTQKEQLKEIKKQTKLLENIKPVREVILK